MSDFGSSPHVVILGAGFSGLLTAVNVRRLSRDPVRLTLVHDSAIWGRGIAYGTRRPEHLLNVAARNMSAFPDLPDHFVNWLRTRNEFELLPERELRERFIPRQVYGDYLKSLAHHYLADATFVRGEAVAVSAEGTVTLSGGQEIQADRVVLATGNEPPAPLPGAETLQGHPGWIGNPWSAWHERLPASGGTLVLLGTGLTTVDAVLTIRALGWQGDMHAVSRHGWLPHAHFRGIEYPEFPPPGVDLAALGLQGLKALMEEHCARLREKGANPAIIVDKLRPFTQRVWQHFRLEEKQAFARELAARWNVLRHRIAPEVHAQVANAQLTGQLRVHAATIDRIEAAGDRVRVHLSEGGPLEGDLVVNATGPQTQFSRKRSALLQHLLRAGLVTPDELDMGVRVDADHVARTADGERSSLLLALGPLLRGTFWETIAVPELRGQALRVAETLLGRASEEETTRPVMMEYMI